MPHAPKNWLPALLAAVIVVSALLLTAPVEAQGPPPPPPPPCPRGYHWDGPRGCWPNHRGIPPLCPPNLAWRHGQCRPMGPAPSPYAPPPPPQY